MKRIAVLTLMAILSAAGILAQEAPPRDSLTLQQAIALVLQRNPSVAQGSHTIESAQSAVDVSRSGYYPTTSTLLSYTRVGPVAEFDFGGTPILLNPANNYDGHIELHQTLYDFRKTSASVDVASSHLTLARDRLTEVRRDLAFATVRSFYTSLLLKESIRVQDELLRALTEYLNVTQRKLDAGTATEFDVLTMRVRVAAAQTQKIDLENKLRQEHISFRQLADLPADYTPLFKGTFEAESLATTAEALMEAAARQRPDLQSAEDAVASAALQVDLAGKHSTPSLNLLFAYGLKNGYIPNLDVLRGNFAAGVSLEIPIFDGFKARSMEEGAHADLLAAQERKRGVESQVKAEIQEAFSNLNASTEKLQTTKLNVQQAQRAEQLARVKYDAGVITNLDLLDAETSLEQAKLTDLQALFGYVLSSFDLKRAAGEQIW